MRAAIDLAVTLAVKRQSRQPGPRTPQTQ
jgi:hypothetical protein